MPEAGYLPIPRKLAQCGVKDMVRISDARMSGTAFGTIVLHVTPDSVSGGPLGLVRNGDLVRLSVKERRIDLLVEDAELKKRAAVAKYVWGKPERGYMRRKSSALTTAATLLSCGRALPRSDGIGRLWSSDIRDDLHTLPLASCQSSGEQG
jgi:dihydroxyacid dehydratase/phosphogluconate dehydratase